MERRRDPLKRSCKADNSTLFPGDGAQSAPLPPSRSFVHAPEVDYEHSPSPHPKLRADVILKLAQPFSGKPSEWAAWSRKFRHIMHVNGAAKFIDAVEIQSDPQQWDPTLSMDIHANGTLFSILSILLDAESEMLVRHAANGSGMMAWLLLKQRFTGCTVAHCSSLLEDLINARWMTEQGESIEAYIARVRNVCVELIDVGNYISDQQQASFLLRGLPAQFEIFRASEMATPSEDLPSLRAKICAYANHLKGSMQRRPTSSVLHPARYAAPSGVVPRQQVTAVQEDTPNTFVFEYLEDDPSFVDWIDESVSVVKTTAGKRCWGCGEEGHMLRNCPGRAEQLRKQREKYLQAQRERVATVRPAREEATPSAPWFTMMVTERVMRIDSTVNESLWLIDSGATSHMTPVSACLERMEPVTIPLGTANKSSGGLAASGKGCVHVVTEVDNGQMVSIVLNDVLYAENLACPILSVSKMVKAGLNVDFVHNRVYRTCDGNSGPTMPIQWIGNLPFLHLKCKTRVGEVSLGKPATNVSQSSESSSAVAEPHSMDKLEMVLPCAAGQWSAAKIMAMHNCLGHCGVKALRRLYPGKVPSSMTSLACQPCALGKSKRLPYPQVAEHTASKPLQLVHVDFWGPVPAEGLEGQRYLFGVWDAYSSYKAVYARANRADKLSCIQKFIQKEGMPDAIRGDNEFSFTQLKDYCRFHGIDLQKSAPYAHQQNGLAERGWGVLADYARAMMIWANAPQEMWPYAWVHAARTSNVVPCRGASKTPSQMFLESPDTPETPRRETAPFPPWGCTAYVHIDKELQSSKVDARALQGVYLGCCRTRRAHKIFVPSQGRIVKSRNVRFDEHLPGWPEGASTLPPELLGMESDTDHSTEARSEDSASPLPLEERAEEGPRRSARLRSVAPVDYHEPELPHVQGLCLAATDEDSADSFAHLYTGRDERTLTFAEVMHSPDSALWKSAIIRELTELGNLDTWELAVLPPGRKCVQHKWVFKRKPKPDGTVERYKARIVGKGFTQRAGVDYFDTFMSVIRPESVRCLLHVALAHGLEAFQLDIGNAFLNAYLKEEIYVSIPEGYTLLGTASASELEGKVMKLKKGLPGLKQSGRNWQECFEKWLEQHGLTQSRHDPCVFYTTARDMLIGVYVDDVVVCCKSSKEYKSFIVKLEESFRVTTLDHMEWFLGLHFQHSPRHIAMDQQQYIQQVLERFGMADAACKAVPLAPGTSVAVIKDSPPFDKPTDYRAAIGSLLYIARWTRPDISFATAFLGRFAHSPTVAAWKALQHVLSYLKSTPSLGLHFTSTVDPLVAYADSDFANDAEDRKSITGYIFMCGANVLSWKSGKQELVATSTTEAEYVAMFSTCQEARFLGPLLHELHGRDPQPVVIYTDSNCAAALANNPVGHKRCKHIDVKFHSVRESVKLGRVSIDRVDTADNPADVFTKAVSRPILQKMQPWIVSDLNQFPCCHRSALPENKGGC